MTTSPISENSATPSSQLSFEEQGTEHQAAQKLDKQIIADYLREHPDFFLEYPDVLAELHVHHQNKGVVSLTQLQSEQYRDKIKALKKQLSKLVENAKRNETIYTTYAKINLAIVQCESFDELSQVLNAALCESLGLSHAVIYPFVGDKVPENKRISEIQQRAIIDKKLNGAHFYFGRLGNNEKNLLFPDVVAESVSLMSIGDDKAIALLAISSKDPMHFTPDMDTTLLAYLRDFLSFHLPKLL